MPGASSQQVRVRCQVLVFLGPFATILLRRSVDAAALVTFCDDLVHCAAWACVAAGSMRMHTLESPPMSTQKIMVLENIDVIDASPPLHQPIRFQHLLALVFLIVSLVRNE